MIVRKTRIGTFETNSSRSHVLVIADSVNYNMTIIPNEVDKSITIPAIDFDEAEERKRYNDPMTKASYLAAGLVDTYNIDEYGATKLKEWLDLLHEVIKDHTGARVVLFSKDGEVGNALDPSLFEQAVKDKETLKNFLFNDGSYFEVQYHG